MSVFGQWGLEVADVVNASVLLVEKLDIGTFLLLWRIDSTSFLCANIKYNLRRGLPIDFCRCLEAVHSQAPCNAWRHSPLVDARCPQAHRNIKLMISLV